MTDRINANTIDSALDTNPDREVSTEGQERPWLVLVVGLVMVGAALLIPSTGHLVPADDTGGTRDYTTALCDCMMTLACPVVLMVGIAFALAGAVACVLRIVKKPARSQR